MQLIEINKQTWVIQGGANIGVLAYEGRCLLIDSGMDKDAFLTPEILDKHRIPFYTDMQLGLMTLATLKQRTGAFKHIVAGHDEIYGTSERADQAIDYMVQRLESILREHKITARAKTVHVVTSQNPGTL